MNPFWSTSLRVRAKGIHHKDYEEDEREEDDYLKFRHVESPPLETFCSVFCVLCKDAVSGSVCARVSHTNSLTLRFLVCFKSYFYMHREERWSISRSQSCIHEWLYFVRSSATISRAFAIITLRNLILADKNSPCNVQVSHRWYSLLMYP